MATPVPKGLLGLPLENFREIASFFDDCKDLHSLRLTCKDKKIQGAVTEQLFRCIRIRPTEESMETYQYILAQPQLAELVRHVELISFSELIERDEKRDEEWDEEPDEEPDERSNMARLMRQAIGSFTRFFPQLTSVTFGFAPPDVVYWGSAPFSYLPLIFWDSAPCQFREEVLRS
ncbi:hypothetical protein QBC47DRAFT_409975 [Echria macrotheca]|uniref:F-box domain-containing protein n=1 Tax=Echria macrotheca TaxID=438768 RepID=A0AAJ0BJ83_9PEZI|nr:hypothetical protein QBC47DRAFT_409975 [Echria macrotheca]